MAELLLQFIPSELVDIVKLYTGHGRWRKGKFIQNLILPDDLRCTMLRNMQIPIYCKYGGLTTLSVKFTNNRKMCMTVMLELFMDENADEYWDTSRVFSYDRCKNRIPK